MKTTDTTTSDKNTDADTPAKKTLAEAIAAGVENWISDNLRNTSFSRDTEAWNKLQAALPKLPGAIIKEVE